MHGRNTNANRNGGSAPLSVTCPHCGAAVDSDPVTVLRPEDREVIELFRGELNRLDCERCGSEFLLASPLLFRDDARRFLIYYLPLEDRTKWPEAERQMQEVITALLADDAMGGLPECRLVLTRRSLVEKIAVHRDGLDDRIVEYVKYQLFSRPEDAIDPVRYELLYDFSQQDVAKLAFILFGRDSGKAEAAAHIPMDVYSEVAEAFLKDDDMRKELDALFAGCYVNVEKLIFA